MIQPSFIPPLAIRELRDLTRRRRQLIRENSRERNRVQKVLEDANVKLETHHFVNLFILGTTLQHTAFQGRFGGKYLPPANSGWH